jgi:ceramide glucosyltransferase
LHILRTIAAGVAGVLAFAGVGYLLAVLWCVRRFATRSIAALGFTPPVSILKPLKGADPQMYESFRSHCLQDYPEFEIIFGVNDANDPAIAEVERLRREFPNIPMQLVVCSEVLGSNRKVSNLVRMLRETRHEHVVINDSDIKVERDYLRKVMAPFVDAKVGLVSALYRAVAGRTLSSAIESLAISTEFPGGILMAINIEHGMHFALGSTLAVTKNSVAAIGGLEVLVDYLADDYELGNRIWRAGYKVELADTVVETFVPDYSFRGMFRHQLRWARTIRDRRSAQYLGLTIVHAIPWALIALLLSGGAMWAWTLLAVTFAVRSINAYVQAADVLHDQKAAGRIWLVPVRDCVALVIWAASFLGSTIAWRDEKFRLKDGKLYPLAKPR